MKATGIRRKVDDLGRVVIPASMRRSLGIGLGDTVEITVEDDRLILVKPAEQCAFCGSQRELTQFRDKVVCWSCTAALRALDREHTDGSTSPFFYASATAILPASCARRVKRRARTDGPAPPGTRPSWADP